MTEYYRIGKSQIPYRLEIIPIQSVAFYAENPRIYSQFTATETRTQEAIQKKLEAMEHVKTLRAQIHRDKQVNEPLWCMPVDQDSPLSSCYDFITLEGNSRLAALKMETRTPPPVTTVPCNILDLSSLTAVQRESFIFSLLGRIHITGKTNWQTYENAAYIYRRYKYQGVSAEELAKELVGLTPAKVSNTVKAYELMSRNEDTKSDHWSYYEVLVSGRKLPTLRDTYPSLDPILLPMIRNEEFQRAQDMRDKIPLIMDNKQARKRFLEGDSEERFEHALEIAEFGGGGNTVLRRLEAFQRFLTQDENEDAIKQLLDAQGTKGKAKFALDKIYDVMARLSPKAQRLAERRKGR